MNSHKLSTLERERAIAAPIDTVGGRTIGTSLERIIRDRVATEHTLFEGHLVVQLHVLGARG